MLMLSPGMTISTPCGQFRCTGNIGGPDVELRFVAGEERGMAAAFFFAQDVNLAFGIGVRFDGTGSGKNLTALDIFTLNTSQQNTDGIAGFA